MERKRITLSGINRSDPDSLVPDGAAMEIINLRPKDGAFRPVGTKKSWLAEAGDVAYLHDINGRYMAAIFYDATAETWSYTVYDNGVKGTSYAITGGDIETLKAVSSLNNTLLIVFDDSGTLTTLKLVFDFDSEQYRVFDGLPNLPLFVLSSEAVSADDDSYTFSLSTVGPTHVASTVLTWVLKTMNDKAEGEDGYYTGPLLIVFAWEMSDGTEIRQSIPYIEEGSGIDVTTDSNNVTVEWKAKDIRLTVETAMTASEINAIASAYDSIISSLNIYATRMKSPELETADSYWIPGVNPNVITPTFKTYSAESLKDESLFYLVKKIDLDEMADTFHGDTEGYVLQGPFNDLSSRNTLSVNQYTHHEISFNGLFSYNSRIFGFNTQTKLFTGFPLTYAFYSLGFSGTAYSLGAEIDITTNEGTKTVFTGWSTFYKYNNIEHTQLGIIFNKFYGYPDSRATTMRLFYKNSLNNVYLLRTISLSRIESFNYSVVNEESLLVFDLSALTESSLSIVNDTYNDKNRIQATAMDNIFSYPAENSYRIGNGAVLGLSSNAVALSSGQFGEYPLYCFTKDGIWTMQMGNGETLIDTIRPLSRDVCDNPDSILQIDGGTIFKTAKGLMMVAGAQVIELSEKAEGNYKNNIRELGNYKEALSDPLISGIHGYLCATDILTYLSGASLSYDYIESEIICSNPSYPYSWVYNMKMNAWHKISEVFAGFVAKFPKNFGKKHEGGNTILYDLTAEEYNDDIPVLYETREMKIIGAGYKKIARSLVGCQLEHNDIDYRVTAQLYGSPDNLKWFRLSASNAFGNASDIVLGRSLFSCRRYICLITGKVKEGSYFTHIEADLEPRYSDKLR